MLTLLSALGSLLLLRVRSRLTLELELVALRVNAGAKMHRLAGVKVRHG
jgi:hypothetical protein